MAERKHDIISANGQNTQVFLKVRKIGWCIGVDKLILFYTLLLERSFISCTFDDFKIHFFGINDFSEKIIWYGDHIELSYVIDELIEKEIVPQRRSWHKLICDHFSTYNEMEERLEELCSENLRKNNFKNGVKGKKENVLIKVMDILLAKQPS